ncbi:YkvA family protein [Thermodesulfobacteriota bacterium]
MGYIFLPFDLIPDWIPVIGYLDDLIIVPFLVIIALKFTPVEVKRECRQSQK